MRSRSVHPRLHELLARGGLRLGDLVLVVREEVVDAARVQVERLAEVLHGHRGALDVPAGAAAPPRGVPADRSVRRLPRLPEREVADVLLVVFVRRAPQARALVVEVDVGELAVAGELADLEVDRAVLALVRDALLHELGDERDHLGDVVRRRGVDLRRLDVQLLQVGEERVLVRLRVVGQSDARGVCAADRLVVDVGEVHHLADLHSVELHDAAEDILERVGAEVADVGEVVDGGSARVEADRVALEGPELLDSSRQRVVDVHHRRVLYQNQSRLRWILPEMVFGSSSRNTTMRGYLYGAVCSLT